MKRGLKVFSLLLLILLVLCSFTSVSAEDTNNISDGLGNGNLNEDITETTSNEVNCEDELMEVSLSSGHDIEAGLSDGKELAGTDSSAEETYGDSVNYKSFRDLYVDIVSHPNNLTLTDDYKYDPEIDRSLPVIGVPDFYANYVIDGQGHTIDASNSARFFLISGENVTLKNINFINGNSSTAAPVHFSVNGNIENCTFTNNYANPSAIVHFDGTGHIIDSTFTNNTAIGRAPVAFQSEGFIDNCIFLENNGTQGGAVRFASNGNVRNSRFEGNRANSGGAIYGFSGKILVDDSDFISNLAELGGAINLYEGTITNSVFNQNVATSVGGAIFSNHFLLIDGCTFQSQSGSDGGALYCNNIGSVQNSIFMDNTAVNKGGAIFFKLYGEAYGNNFTNNNAGLGFGKAIHCENTLANYLNSFEDESIDVYSNRTFNFKAFYLDGSVANSGDGSIASPWKTFDDVIEYCNNYENILISPGIYNGEKNVGLQLKNSFNLYGMGEVIFDGEGESYIWDVLEGVIKIDGMTFRNGFNEYGGAMHTSEDSYLFINNSKFINNSAQMNGGAIYAQGYVELDNCYFNKNTQLFALEDTLDETLGGGAITGTFPLSMLFVKNCVFEENIAEESAGALQVGAFAYIDNCRFERNKAFIGGAIRSYVTSNLMFSDAGSMFISNNASDWGGAICLVFVNSPIRNLYFENNIVENGSGGAIFGLYSDNVHEHGSQYMLHLLNCSFIANKAKNMAGAVGYGIDKDSATLRLDGCYFYRNSANYGGAIYSFHTLECMGEETSFIENEAKNYTVDHTNIVAFGGAIMHFGKFDFRTTVRFIGNKASGYGYGGAICAGGLSSQNSIIQNAIFIDNKCDKGGGGAVYTNHNLTIANCEFKGNDAHGIPGGSIYSKEEVTITVIKNNFINISADSVSYGEDVYNKYGYFVMNNNYFVSRNYDYYILAATSKDGLVKDNYKATYPWDLNADLSQLAIKFIPIKGDELRVLDKDYSLDYGEQVEFPVNGDLIVDGQGHRIKGYDRRLLCLKVYGSITFKNIIFDGSREFVSIYNNGQCNFINCTFSSIDGDGKGAISIYDSGICNIRNSTFSENSAGTGGAISVYGSGICNIWDSDFIQNNAWLGGAIYSENEVNAKNCNFSYNFVDGENTKGGAIYSKILSLENCTFYSNVADYGGGAVYAYKLIPNNSTFFHNYAPYGGAIYIDGNTNEVLEISANNFLFNIASDKGGAIYINNTNLHLMLNENYFYENVIYDGIGYVAYNLGEYDEIIYNNWGTDYVDFENEPILVKKTPSLEIYCADLCMVIDPDQTVKVFPFSFLQKEVNSKEVILLKRDYAYISEFEGEEEYVNGVNITRDNLVIDGQGHVIDGRGMSRIFNILGQNVTLRNIIFANGFSNDSGGAISGGNFALYNCSFINNSAGDSGGAIRLDSTSGSEISQCVFINNSAGDSGGAIRFIGFQDEEISQCVFINNSAGDSGGAVFLQGKVIVNQSSFEDNRAFNGGAIYFLSGGTVYDSYFTNNHASYFGGAIYSHGDLTLSYYVTFNENEARNGSENYYLINGANLTILEKVYRNFTELQSLIDNSEDSVIKLTYDYSCQEVDSVVPDDRYPGVIIIRDNLVIDGQGHTIDGRRVSRIFKVYSDNVTFKNIIFINGKTDFFMGAATEFLEGFGSVINCTFRDNSAVRGGAVSFPLKGGYVESCIFDHNVATILYGGAVSCLGDLYIKNVTFRDNSSGTEIDTCYVRGQIIDVSPRDPNLSILINNVSQILPLVVEIGTNETYSGNVTLEIVDVNYTVPIVNGYGSIVIEGLKKGIYTATVTFNASGVFNDSVKSVMFEIYSSPLPGLKVDVGNITVGDDVSVEIRINDTISGLIPIQIADVNAPDDIIAFNYVVVYKGYGTVAIGNLDVGTYIASAFFNGSDMFDPENDSIIFEVSPQLFGVFASRAVAGLPNPTSINDDSSVKEMDSSVKKVDSSVKVADSSVKKVDSSVKVADSSVKKIDPNLKISVSSIRVGQKAIIRISANKIFSGKVNVKIGSKTYAVNVVKGKGTRAINGLKVGSYKATAKLVATNDFKASTKTVGFKVKPHVINLSLKKVTVKRATKKLIITAALRIDGKLAKGKKLTFLFKGKRYVAKTNKKGIAKIIIYKKVLKKLKVGKKVTYQVKYGKKSVRRTVKVKK